jgi:hypothetical protein
MLLQTNSYVVPRDRRTEHAKLLRRFRQALLRLGCESFEVYEQVGPNWNVGQSTGRFVQIMRFRDRRHQQAVQQAEQADATAQKLIAEFCELINFPYQQQQGFFATSFYANLFGPEPGRSAAEQARPEAEPTIHPVDRASEGANGKSPNSSRAAVAGPGTQSLIQPRDSTGDDALEDELAFVPAEEDDAFPADSEPSAEPVIPRIHADRAAPAGNGEGADVDETPDARPLIEPLEDRSHHAGDENPLLEDLP